MSERASGEYISLIFDLSPCSRILSQEELSVTRKKPFVRFLLWVYMHTDAGNTSRNTLAHGEYVKLLHEAPAPSHTRTHTHASCNTN